VEQQVDVETCRGSVPSDEQEAAMPVAAVAEYDPADVRTPT